MQRVAFVFVTIFRRPSQSLHHLLGQPAIPSARVAATRSFSGIGNRRPLVRIGVQRYTEPPVHRSPQVRFVSGLYFNIPHDGGSYLLLESHSQQRTTTF